MCGGTGLKSEPCEVCGGDGWVSNASESAVDSDRQRPEVERRDSRPSTPSSFNSGIPVQVVPNPATGMIQIHFEGDVKARMGRETDPSGARIYYVELRPAYHLGEKTEWSFPGETMDKVWVSQGEGAAQASCRVSVRLAPGAKARMLSGPNEVRLLVEGVQ